MNHQQLAHQLIQGLAGGLPVRVADRLDQQRGQLAVAEQAEQNKVLYISGPAAADAGGNRRAFSPVVFPHSRFGDGLRVGVVTELVEGDVYHWGSLMAGALMGSLPVAILYSFFVEHYVSSLTGAVKE